jgi:hypothetical protein
VAANQGTNTVPADVKHTNKEVLQEDRIGMEVPVSVTQLAQCSTQPEVTIQESSKPDDLATIIENFEQIQAKKRSVTEQCSHRRTKHY